MDAGWRPGGSVISHVYQLNARASRYIRQYGRAGPGVSAGYRGSPSHPQRAPSAYGHGPVGWRRLAVSGVLMQTVTRNPLASETTLGVNAGAYLAVVAGMIFWPGLLHQYALPLAVAGGTLAAVAVYALAGKRRALLRIALSGMIVTLVLSSVTSALVLLNQQTTQGIFLWGSGSLIQNDWDGVAFHGRGSLAG